MKTSIEFRIADCAEVAYKSTLRAANVKDYKLRRNYDRQMKAIAMELIKGRGYIIATAKELEMMYPNFFNTSNVSSPKMIWAIDFAEYRHGNRMAFIPVR